MEEQKKTPFKKWYEKNAAKLAEARKRRYQNDPEYRDAILKRQQSYRRNHPGASRAGESRLKKTASGQLVETFRIGEVAQMIGRSDQTIRDWEDAKLIPTPTIQSAHRYYTKQQVALMRELAQVIDIARSEGREVLGEAVAQKSREIHQNWQLGD